MEREKIKKCPFCGEFPKVHENYPLAGLYTISCEYSECTVKPYTMGRTPEEMIRRWNTRN